MGAKVSIEVAAYRPVARVEILMWRVMGNADLVSGCLVLEQELAIASD
jgi:hypothetical protein